MDINNLRNEIDKIDNELLELLIKRLMVVDEIGKNKKANGVAVKNKERENEILERVSKKCPPEYADSCSAIFEAVFDASCKRQFSGRFALIGGRLKHSYSKELHALLGEYSYDLCEVGAGEVEQLMRSGRYDGFNVTIPHKLTAYSLCDRLSDEAVSTGSVNTVVRSGGALLGYNTDCFGFEFLLRHNGISLAGKKVLVLGSGGVSKTVIKVAKGSEAKAVQVISRSGENNYLNLNKFYDYEIIVNATPVGMYPDNGVSPVNISEFHSCEAVVDLVYNPLKTKLMLDAQSLKIKTVGGLLMLCAQGAKARELFTGEAVDETEIVEAHNKLLMSKTNVVLVGMPGCGKSSAARLIGNALSRPVVDIDDEIIRLTGMSVEKIFAEKGEEFFRKAESDVIARVGKLSGAVIACGGGSVLTEHNRLALIQNGAVVYLKRSLDKLETGGRPLSTDICALERLFAEREPIYIKMSDIAVDTERLGLI